MTSYTRAVTLLRQVSVILSENLASVDLYALRSDTFRAPQNGMTDVTAEIWRDVLAAVSPTLVEFGRELTRVDAVLARRKRSVERVQILIWTLEGTIAMAAFAMMCDMVAATPGNGDLAGSAVQVGVVVSVSLVILSVFGIWNTSINEMYRKLRSQELSPMHDVLRNYANSLSRRMIVAVVAAIASGGNAALAMKNYMAQDAKTREIWDRTQCDSKSVNLKSCDIAGMDPCSISSYTLETIKVKIKLYCRELLIDIASVLIDLKDLGVERYERASLWSAVRSGVEAVRALTIAGLDAKDPARAGGLTRDVLIAVVRDEVVPILKLPGVESKGWVFDEQRQAGTRGYGPVGALLDSTTQVSAESCITFCRDNPNCASVYYSKESSCYRFKAPFGTSDVNRDGSDPNGMTSNVVTNMIQLDGKDGVEGELPARRSTMSPSKCERSCFDTPRDTKALLGFFIAKDGKCYVGTEPTSAVSTAEGFESRYVLLRSGFTIASTTAKPDTVGTLVFMRPPEFDASATSVLQSVSDYAGALRAPGAAAATLQRQSTEVASRLLRVLRRLRFVLDLDAMRAYIDRDLAAYYGPAVYGTAEMAAAMNSVLRRVRDVVYRARREGPQRFVDPERLQQKLLAMSSDEVAETQVTLQTLRDATDNMNRLYPTYRSVSGRKTAIILSTLGGIVILTALCVYLTIVWSMHSEKGLISYQQLCQRCIISMCLSVLVLFTVETVAYKAVARIEHNQTVADDNGTMLVGASIRANDQFAATCIALGIVSSPTQPRRNAPASSGALSSVSALLADCRGVIEKYELCNSIMSGQVSMPMPMAEVAMYGSISIVFIVLSMLIVIKVDPLQRLDSIRSLQDLSRRIKLGEASAMHEAMSVVECSRPTSEVWSLFIWGGVSMFMSLTWWFAMSSQNIADDYKDSLDQRADCA